jgi:TPP-dependent indolepyruvate ferredoxin oxidoreductase alpha subunit
MADAVEADIPVIAVDNPPMTMTGQQSAESIAKAVSGQVDTILTDPGYLRKMSDLD